MSDEPAAGTDWGPNVFGDPRYVHYTPLRLGWSDEQLEPVADLLRHHLPSSLTERMVLAAAACAMSVVCASKSVGCGVRYSRRKEDYRRLARYRDGDPRNTYHFIVSGMDRLREAELVGHALGQWFPGRVGLQTVAWPTDGLLDLIGHIVDPDTPRKLVPYDETVVLRDADDKRDVGYDDTATTNEWRRELDEINTATAQIDLRLDGEVFPVPVIRRVFSGTFERGGRLYCHGPSFQNIRRDERRRVTITVDGIRYPAVEVDYSNLHAEMAYRAAGKRPRGGDQYEIEGFDRGLVKIAFNILLNAATEEKARLAVTEELMTNTDIRRASGKHYSRKSCSTLARGVIKAIQEKHHKISRFFGSDCGATFQRGDSDMAVEVIRRMITRTGRAPLVMHDSFLVADIDKEVLVAVMREVAGECGLFPALKTTHSTYSERIRQPTWPPLSFLLWVKACEQQRLKILIAAHQSRLQGLEGQRLRESAHGRASTRAGFSRLHDPPLVWMNREQPSLDREGRYRVTDLPGTCRAGAGVTEGEPHGKP